LLCAGRHFASQTFTEQFKLNTNICDVDLETQNRIKRNRREETKGKRKKQTRKRTEKWQTKL
jgi:hypothetical protein